MAKLTIEEAKLKLAPVAKAIDSLKQMGVDIPATLTTEYERLAKIISGNANANVAATFNEKLAPQINKNAAFVELLAGQVGTRAKLVVVVVTAEDGSKSISFEASTNAGGSKTGSSNGTGTKTSTPYNKYDVTVTGDLPEYAQKSGSFDTASKAVAFILNNGKNPMNKVAEYGKGNSMVRVLEGFEKEEAFTKNFKLERSYVAVEKKAVEPAKTEASAETTEAPAE